MDIFLDTSDHPNLSQEDINYLNKFINSLPKKESPEPDRLTAEFYHTFIEELIRMLLKFLHGIEREITLPKSSYGVSITLIPNQTRIQQQQKKRIIGQPLLITKIQKFSMKYWQTEFSNITKKIIQNDQVSFIPGMQRWFNINH
jgi:UDP-galactopyranose mutase